MMGTVFLGNVRINEIILMKCDFAIALKGNLFPT